MLKDEQNFYKISESTIIEDTNFSKGKHEILTDVSGFKYPLKVVIAIEADIITVITSYPLRKRMGKNESIL